MGQMVLYSSNDHVYKLSSGSVLVTQGNLVIILFLDVALLFPCIVNRSQFVQVGVEHP